MILGQLVFDNCSIHFGAMTEPDESGQPRERSDGAVAMTFTPNDHPSVSITVPFARDTAREFLQGCLDSLGAVVMPPKPRLVFAHGAPRNGKQH